MTTATMLSLLGLGAVHGINPGMGWLFAVGLGLQDGKSCAVWRALPPLALGHLLAVAVAVAIALVAGAVLPRSTVTWVVAAALLALGVQRLVRHRHPRYGGMRVTRRELTIWSFLMASAHGAGLMVVPVLLAATGRPSAHAGHGGAALDGALLATVVHAAGYLAVAGVLALVVYERVGVGVLRRAWINVDLFWALSLIVTGLVVLVI